MTNCEIALLPLGSSGEAREKFISDIQWAFKYGAMLEFGRRDESLDPSGEIISRRTVEDSIDADGAEPYRIVFEGREVGGVIVVIDEATQKNSLDLFFIDPREHGKGLGYAAWRAIEARYPETVEWETVTPYFEKRNVHFYVNKCGFKIVEFYNAHNPDPHAPEDPGDEPMPAESFRFIKTMK